MLVARYMLGHPLRGLDRGSVITGKSTTKELRGCGKTFFSGCICFFYYFFYFLEDAGILNTEDEVDLYSLHYVFVPVIQKQLDVFRHAWACHPLRTEGNRSPQQLWILGLQAMSTQDHQHEALTGTKFNVVRATICSSQL